MVSSWLLLALLSPQEPASPGPVKAAAKADEARYVAIETVPIPEEVVLEVGGLVQWGGDWYAATRRGEIWRLHAAGTEQAKWTLWADGLQEPLGLLVHDGWLYSSQRGELSRMRDRDGDGRMDDLETFAQGWPLSGNYHEYCFGPALAPDGSFWLTLNKPFGGEPFGRAPWRGWAIRIPKEGGSFEPVCAGLRSPAGVGVSPEGEVWYTDNQGEWCPTSKFSLLEPGDFHGHPWGIESCKLPASKVEYPGEVRSGQRIAEAAANIPHFKLPAVWIPYDVCGRSPAGFVWDTEGHFGPFRGQVFCGDQYSSEVFRMSLEKVDGHWQGACYPFRHGLQCGITRVAWGSDGALWCGLTNRGWGSLGDREQGLQRLVWRGETPFETKTVTALPAGFRLTMTKPVEVTSTVAAFHVRSWTYDLHESYGCPPRDVREHTVGGVGVSADGAVLDLAVEGLEDGRVYEIKIDGLRSRDGETVWHDVAWYTRNLSPR
ncbi:MAG: auracyanin family protein [Planctomycetes bacterium]|nr:auracyanin family protein [Planctomycetota bacterium]